MKVNLLIYNERTARFHVDNFDLYHARSRRTFTMESADEIGASESQLRSDLGRVLLKLEQLQAEKSSYPRLQANPNRSVTSNVLRRWNCCKAKISSSVS